MVNSNFLRHTSCNKCGSSDAGAEYSNGGFYCFSCQYYVAGENTEREDMQEEDVVQKEDKLISKFISKEDVEAIRSNTSFDESNFRAITKETRKFFGVRSEHDEDGNVIKQYYPCIYKGNISGYKYRKIPKDFKSIGLNSKDCELFGQYRFKDLPNNSRKYVVIVGGEEDAQAGYQMIAAYNKSKNNPFVVAVVSSTVGEQGHKQLATNYDFLNSFDNIILGLDNDEAGEKAALKALEYLPKGKVKVAKWSLKDPNEMLMKGKAREFIQDFYSAKNHIPVGVVGSGNISEDMRSEFNVPKIPLPKFMHKLQDMMAGGIPLGRIVNLASSSGTGKSTIVDEIIYDMIFNSPHKCGIVTLESTAGQYGIKLLSRHIGRKLELLSNDEALEYLNTDKVKEQEHYLFWDNEEHRFFLVDDRDGGAEDIKSAVENLIIACQVKVIILDPLSDIISRLPNEEQEDFMQWQKGMVKSHNVTFINVVHTRKKANSEKAGSVGGDLVEEDMHGSSSIYKSGACNLVFSRNKEAEDEIERNTTIMKATKIRWTGKTGIAGKYYYDIQSHTLYDLEDYLLSKTSL